MPKTVAEDDVVVYPEIITDTPLKAKNVVYWLLKKPGALTQEMSFFAHGDILVT